MPHFCLLCFAWAFSYSLALQVSRLILYFPCPSPRIFHSYKNLWVFLIDIWSLEAKFWVAGVLVITGVSLGWGLFVIYLFVFEFVGLPPAFISKSCLLKNYKSSQDLHIKVKITVIMKHKFCFLNWYLAPGHFLWSWLLFHYWFNKDIMTCVFFAKHSGCYLLSLFENDNHTAPEKYCLCEWPSLALFVVLKVDRHHQISGAPNSWQLRYVPHLLHSTLKSTTF